MKEINLGELPKPRVMDRCEMMESKIKKWLEIVNKDIEENKSRDYRAKEQSNGDIEVSYYRIVYSPENVKKMLEEIMNEKT